MDQKPLTNKEKYENKRQEKVKAQESLAKKKRLRRIIVWLLVAVLIIGIIGILVWYIATRPKVRESDIISKNGLHWHPELTIYIKGEKQEIPANIGISGAVHNPIHTHDDSNQGIIHMEFQGLVKKQDTTLVQFFKNWGKNMRSFGANIKMIVNGHEINEYENYLMHDKDKIELYYE